MEEHDDQRHQKGPGLGAVSPGHPGSHVPSAASWQQQLSARLAQEKKWVCLGREMECGGVHGRPEIRSAEFGPERGAMDSWSLLRANFARTSTKLILVSAKFSPESTTLARHRSKLARLRPMLPSSDHYFPVLAKIVPRLTSMGQS